MCLKDSFFARYQIVCVIFHKGSTFGIFFVGAHDLHQADHGCCLPVTLAAEAVAFFHKALDCKTWKLFQGSQITEMCYDSLIVFLLKETLKTDLDPCLDCYVFLKFFRVTSIQNHVIFIIIFFYQNINISLAYVLYIFCDLVNRISIDLPSKFHLSLNFIAFGYGYVSHVVGNTAYTDMATFHDTNCSTHPGCQTLLNFFVCPVSCDDFTLDSHAGYHMAKLTSAVCGLVLIHEVHINGVIWDFHIELCMKMAQWFAVFLKTKDPGFCRGKCMHPCDHTGAGLICICLIKCFTDQLVCDQSWFPYNLKWKYAGFVQFFYDNFGMLCYLAETLISVKIL